MGGAMDWMALPFIAEMIGVSDIEAFVHRILTIRNWKAENRD